MTGKRIGVLLAHLFEEVRSARWAIRRQGLLLVAAAIVLLGTPILLVAVNRVGDPQAAGSRDAVTQAAALLVADFAGNVERLDDGFIRKFAGADDEAMVGTVARAGADGVCWGFTVAIPGTWLRDGSGEIAVGTVGERDRSDCAA